MLLFGLVFVITLVVLYRRRKNRRSRSNAIYDQTIALQQAEAHQMAVLRRDPRTGKVDV